MGRRPHTVADDGGALLRAKALAAPTRVALLELLEASPTPLTAFELADGVAVHHTAVRQHLALLVEAGLVAAEPQPPQGRGRPRTAYRAVHRPDPYRDLSTMLAEAVAESLTPREVGRRHGAKVDPVAGGPVATLRAEAARLGFAPRLSDGHDGRTEVVLDRCPFADVAVATPDAVCELHLGIAEGIAERVGGIEILGLHPADPLSGGCRLVVLT